MSEPIDLDAHFSTRFYQEAVLDAWENKKKNKLLFVLPRRCGMDYLAFHMVIRQCVRKTCLVYYILPTFRSVRNAVWDAISVDGIPFLSLIPKQLVANVNRSELSITFTNGSKLKFLGAMNVDNSAVGSNAQMIIISEAGVMQQRLQSLWEVLRPMLTINHGTALIF